MPCTYIHCIILGRWHHQAGGQPSLVTLVVQQILSLLMTEVSLLVWVELLVRTTVNNTLPLGSHVFIACPGLVPLHYEQCKCTRVMNYIIYQFQGSFHYKHLCHWQQNGTQQHIQKKMY